MLPAVLVAMALGAGAAPHVDLRPIQAAIDRESKSLQDDHDIYLASTGRARGYVAVDLYNPTAANRRYVERRFGPRVRVDRRPAGQFIACAGGDAPPAAPGPVTVPDVRGLDLVTAERRLVDAGLAFALGCPYDADTEPVTPSRYGPEALGRITDQCPAPGQPVTAGQRVALGAASELPGGFTYRFGAFRTEAYDAQPCENGRDLDPPPTPPEHRVRSPRGYAVQVDAGGAPTSVAAVDGTLLWTTTPNAVDESGSTGRKLTLHVLAPGATVPTGVRVRSRRDLFGLTAGTDATGRLVVLAIANRGYGGDVDFPDPRNVDVVTIDPGSGVVRSLVGAARPGVAETAVALHRGRLVLARGPEPGARRPRPGLWTGRLVSARRVGGLRERRGARRFLRPRTRVEELALTGAGRVAAIVEDPRRLGGEFQSLWVLDDRGARSVPDTRGLPDERILWSLSWQDDRRLWFGRTNRARQYQGRYDAVTGRQVRRFPEATEPIDTAWVGGRLGLVAASDRWPGDEIRPSTLFATGSP